ncbi:MAG: hypothetical protein HC778_00365 [Chamaesiphon sp. CSU_1_12]|nr:hypothetical protein [Chamaesiphon sp. CSU_1_12]
MTLSYDCYIQAYLTDISSKPNFWTETPELLKKNHLEKFQSLLKWRLKDSFKVSFFDKISLFLNLINFSYGINIEDLVDNYKNNIDLYIRNISNILIENASSISASEQDILHTLDKEDLSSHNTKNLFWNPKAYDYLKIREKCLTVKSQT